MNLLNTLKKTVLNTNHIQCNSSTNNRDSFQRSGLPSHVNQIGSHSLQPVVSSPSGAYPPNTILTVGERKVVVEKFLAEGGYAHVYSVLSLPDEQAVLKRIACPDEDSLLDVRREITFMKILSGHKHIVTYFDSDVQPLSGGAGYEVFILMENCEDGHLVDFLNTRLTNRLTETEVINIFFEVCEAVAHMHYADPPIIHRDLKVENVLITSSGIHKVCDFGSATTRQVLPNTPMNAGEIRMLEEEVTKYTTLQYRAPEMCDLYARMGMTEKTDMWALGVLLYKLCYFTTPFEEGGKLAILNGRYAIPNYPVYSDTLKGLIESMLVVDIHKRANIYQVYSAVCKLRSVPCFLQNKYPDVVPASDIYAQQFKQLPLFQSRTSSQNQYINNPIIQQEPFITQPSLNDSTQPEMRRGRPPKQQSVKPPGQNLSGFLNTALVSMTEASDHSLGSGKSISMSSLGSSGRSMNSLSASSEPHFFTTAGGQLQQRNSGPIQVKPEQSNSIFSQTDIRSNVSSTSKSLNTNPFEEDAFHPFNNVPRRNSAKSIPDLKGSSSKMSPESAHDSFANTPHIGSRQSQSSIAKIASQQQQNPQPLHQAQATRGHLRTHSVDSDRGGYIYSSSASGRPRMMAANALHTMQGGYGRSEIVQPHSAGASSTWAAVQTVDVNLSQQLQQSLAMHHSNTSHNTPMKPSRVQANTPQMDAPPSWLPEKSASGTFRPTHSAPSSRMGSQTGVQGVDPNGLMGFLDRAQAVLNSTGLQQQSQAAAQHLSNNVPIQQQQSFERRKSWATQDSADARANASYMLAINTSNVGGSSGMNSVGPSPTRQSWASNVSPILMPATNMFVDPFGSRRHSLTNSNNLPPHQPNHGRGSSISWAPGSSQSNNPFAPGNMPIQLNTQVSHQGNTRMSWTASRNRSDPFGDDAFGSLPITNLDGIETGQGEGGAANWLPLVPRPGGSIGYGKDGFDSNSNGGGRTYA